MKFLLIDISLSHLAGILGKASSSGISVGVFPSRAECRRRKLKKATNKVTLEIAPESAPYPVVGL